MKPIHAKTFMSYALAVSAAFLMTLAPLTSSSVASAEEGGILVKDDGSAEKKGDKPAKSSSSTGAGSARDITNRLFELLRQDHGTPDLYISILMAIGMQPTTAVSDRQREVLQDCVVKGKLYGRKMQALVRSYACLALGRIGKHAQIGAFEGILFSRRVKNNNIKRSAAIGLGLLGKLANDEERVKIAKTLLKAIDKGKLKDASAQNFAFISLAYLILYDVQAGKTAVISDTKADETLLKVTVDGRLTQKPYGALSLALISREIGDTTSIKKLGDFRSKALETIRNSFRSGKGLDSHARAGFAVSLGIAKDTLVVKELTKVLSDRKADPFLRAYCALGLGLIGIGTNEVKVAIREALKDRRSKDLRQQAAVALGLLQDQEAVPLLLKELDKAKTQAQKGLVILALAKVGDARSVAPLIKRIKNPREKDLTRALCVAGLGVIGDLEWIPSLSRISENVNYRASTDVMREVLSII